MKPDNTRPPLLLEDGAPVRCSFMRRADAPVFWEECEQDATVELTSSEIEAFDIWQRVHPRAVIRIRNSWGHLCDTHEEIIREIIG